MDVEKLFQDIGKELTLFDALKQATFVQFAALAEQGYPDVIIVSMAQDAASTGNVCLDRTINVFFDMWKAERSGT